MRNAVEATASTLTVASVLGRVRSRDMQVWAVRQDGRTRGVVCTEVYDTAAGLTCAIPVVAGEGFDEWWPLIRVIEAWARERGCVRLEGVGRPGWDRKLRHDGWRRVAVNCAKDLD